MHSLFYQLLIIDGFLFISIHDIKINANLLSCSLVIYFLIKTNCSMYLPFVNDVYYEGPFEHPDCSLKWRSGWTEDANIQKYFPHQKLMAPVFCRLSVSIFVICSRDRSASLRYYIIHSFRKRSRQKRNSAEYLNNTSRNSMLNIYDDVKMYLLRLKE